MTASPVPAQPEPKAQVDAHATEAALERRSSFRKAREVEPKVGLGAPMESSSNPEQKVEQTRFDPNRASVRENLDKKTQNQLDLVQELVVEYKSATHYANNVLNDKRQMLELLEKTEKLVDYQKKIVTFQY